MNGTDPNGEFWFISAIIAAIGAFAVAHPIVTAAAIGVFATGNLAIGIAGGAAVGAAQSAATGQNPHYGALIGAGFGAIGAYAGSIPAVAGQGLGAYVANAALEFGTEAGIGALRGGLTALANGGEFGEGAADGATFGAGFGATKVAFLGAKFRPQFSDERISDEFMLQTKYDRTEHIALRSVDPSSANFRVGGLLPLINGLLTAGDLAGRSITLGNSMSLAYGDRANIAVLAHELRHVAQIRALGIARFYARYLYESATRMDQFYQPGNPTLEPYYGQ